MEAEELEEAIYKELARTPECGDQFAAAVRAVLARETKCGAVGSTN